MENNIESYKSKSFVKEEAYLRAEKRVKELKGFYAHAFWYIVVNTFIIVMIASNTNGSIWHFGTFATPVFWGLGLGFHALCVFGKSLVFSKGWEEQKIKEYMEKEDQEGHKFQ